MVRVSASEFARASIAPMQTDTVATDQLHVRVLGKPTESDRTKFPEDRNVEVLLNTRELEEGCHAY